MKKISLFLFDGEGTAPAEGTAAVEGSTDNEVGTQKNVVYGVQPDETESETQENNHPQLDYEQFKEQFKEQYQEDVQKVINKRFKNSKKVEKERDALKQQLDSLNNVLGARYGTNSFDDLLKAVEGDKSYIEAEALRQGKSVEEIEAEIKADMLSKELQRKNDENAQAAQVQKWQQEAEALTELYPEFNLADEIDNEKFSTALQNGMTMRDAYQYAHFDEIVSGAIQYAAKTVKSAVAKAKAERQARPAENGTRSAAAAIVKNDVSKLTKADIEEINKKVMRGERITF